MYSIDAYICACNILLSIFQSVNNITVKIYCKTFLLETNDFLNL